jgi:RNA polymerase sigma-70 factor (ECF subfamily)
VVSLDAERRQRFEAIAAEVYDPLQRYIRRRVSVDDAGDLFSDVLLVIWRRVDDVPGDTPLPWVYAVARRVISNHRRSTQRRLHLVQRLQSEPTPTMILDPAESLADPELARAISALPAHDQEVLRLWAWEQMEPREIAAVLGSTANAVSLRLSRARKKLGDELTRQDPPPSGHIAERHVEEHRG